MSNFAKITLDTTGPAGVSVMINNGETKTTSLAVNLTISCADEILTGYQMKIWGVEGAETESAATWETYNTTKAVTLLPSDGTKTVYVKVRDDVWNESATATDTINLYTSIPTVSNVELSMSKISRIDKKNYSAGSCQFDEAIDAVKIMIVDNINAAHNASTNCSIPTTGGSYIYDEDNGDAYPGSVLEYETTDFDPNMRFLEFEVKADDILSVSPGDGVKIIKVFVRSATSGNWSA